MIFLRMKAKITDRDIASFEAGIKLGALYHQFIGMPISVETASYIEKAIEKAVSLQPYVTNVDVKIDKTKIKSSQNVFRYSSLSGDMIRATVEVKYKSFRVKASLKYNKRLKYPLMSIEEIQVSD